MPYKRKQRKVKRKRKTKSVYKASNFLPVANYGVKLDPFPMRLRTRSKYIFNYRLQTHSVLPITGQEYSFRMNSIYDPDFTDSTGPNNTSVVGHGIFRQLYDRYIVNGIRIEIEWSNPSKDGLAGIVSINQKDVLQYNSYRYNMEQPLTYSTILNNTGSQTKKMVLNVKPWNVLGLSKLEWQANTTRYSAQIDDNPTDICYLRLGICNSSESDGTVDNTMQVAVRMIYDVTLYDRYTLIPA